MPILDAGRGPEYGDRLREYLKRWLLEKNIVKHPEPELPLWRLPELFEGSPMDLVNPLHIPGAAGLIKAGYLDKIKRLPPSEVDTFQGSGGMGWNRYKNVPPVETSTLRMHTGNLGDAVQTMLERPSPQEIRVFDFPDIQTVPAEAYRHQRPHFQTRSEGGVGGTGVGHARAVPFKQTIRSKDPHLNLWEEIQQEMKYEKGLPARTQYTTQPPRSYERAAPTTHGTQVWYPDGGPYFDGEGWDRLFNQQRGRFDDIIQSWPQDSSQLRQVEQQYVNMYHRMPDPFKAVIESFGRLPQDGYIGFEAAARGAVDFLEPRMGRQVAQRHIGSIANAVAEGATPRDLTHRMESLIRNFNELTQFANSNPQIIGSEARFGQRAINTDMIRMMMDEAHSKGKPFIMADVPTVFNRGGGSVSYGKVAPSIKDAYQEVPRKLGMKRDVLEFKVKSSYQRAPHSTARFEEGVPTHGLESIPATSKRGYKTVRVPVWIDQRSKEILESMGKGKRRVWTPEQSEWAGNPLRDPLSEQRNYENLMDQIRVFMPETERGSRNFEHVISITDPAARREAIRNFDFDDLSAIARGIESNQLGLKLDRKDWRNMLRQTGTDESIEEMITTSRYRRRPSTGQLEYFKPDRAEAATIMRRRMKDAKRSLRRTLERRPINFLSDLLQTYLPREGQ